MVKRFASVAVLVALSASPVSAQYISDGHRYALRCNADGYALTSDHPVYRAVGSGAATRYQKERERLFLGASCDARHSLFGAGKWCWANGGFWAEFEGHKFSFPRQELICQKQPDYETDCRC